LSYSVLIADDNAGTRRLVRACIQQSSAAEVCGEAENGAEAVEKVKQLQPNIVILDFKMPVLDGLKAASQIRRLAPETKIILFTMFDSKPLTYYAQIFGVDEVVPKSDGGNKLLAAIRSVGRKSH
jgi:DNA-binding NarL/FixJ family response regulator